MLLIPSRQACRVAMRTLHICMNQMNLHQVWRRRGIESPQCLVCASRRIVVFPHCLQTRFAIVRAWMKRMCCCCYSLQKAVDEAIRVSLREKVVRRLRAVYRMIVCCPSYS